jgi:3-mercaptopyruvate sulfurtransferase SseA
MVESSVQTRNEARTPIAEGGHMVRFTGVLLALLALAAPATPQQAQPAPAPRIPMAEFKKLQAENNVLVIDVRDAQSFATGHIPGARSMPLATLLEPANLADLKATKKEIVLYCA